MFFALSTGRAGSQTLAHVLTQSPDCLCLHEPHPQLVAESARYRYGTERLEDVVAVLRRTRPVVDPERPVYGETANRLGLLVPAVRRAFPQAQLLWLVRDGRGFVTSQLQRGAYGERDRRADDPFARWRLQGDRTGALDARTWAGMDAFERLCWSWRTVNRWIDEDTADLDASRRRLLRIEDLADGLDDLAAWLGITPVDWQLTRSNRRRQPEEGGEPASRHPGRNVVGEVATWEAWSSTQRAVFERWCGDLMDRLYPGWRSPDGRWHAIAPARERSAAVISDGDAAAERLQIARLTVALHEERSAGRELTRRASLRWQLTERAPETLRRGLRQLRIRGRRL